VLSIPWVIVSVLYGFAAILAAFAAWFALMFTGRYPEGLYNFVSGFVRFYARFNGWFYLLTDEWPAFNGRPDDSYPIRLAIPAPQEEYSRLKTFFRLIHAIPVLLISYVMNILVQVMGVIALVVLVFTAKLPEWVYKPLRAGTAYQAKACAYFLFLTEEWPPFWTEEADEAPRLGIGTSESLSPETAPTALVEPIPGEGSHS